MFNKYQFRGIAVMLFFMALTGCQSKSANPGSLVSPSANKTRVIMEECVNGEGAKTLRKKDPAAMHRGHDLWNNTLKKLSEGK